MDNIVILNVIMQEKSLPQGIKGKVINVHIVELIVNEMKKT